MEQEHANFKTHYVDNPDIQNRDLALMKMIGDAFRTALQDSIRRLVSL
ncbi:MAG: hypothetical protein QE277_10960 [Flectobacillus sp.]|nr:hypothetical protein [Flectobacillus sp.]